VGRTVTSGNEVAVAAATSAVVASAANEGLGKTLIPLARMASDEDADVRNDLRSTDGNDNGNGEECDRASCEGAGECEFNDHAVQEYSRRKTRRILSGYCLVVRVLVLVAAICIAMVTVRRRRLDVGSLCCA
jgi:hypothetical protein